MEKQGGERSHDGSVSSWRARRSGHTAGAPGWLDWLQLLSYVPPVAGVPIRPELLELEEEPLFAPAEMDILCRRMRERIARDGLDWRCLRTLDRALSILTADLEASVRMGRVRHAESRELCLAEASLHALHTRLGHLRLYRILAPRAVVQRELRCALSDAANVLAFIRRVR